MASLLVIVGPTASGKSLLAVRLAQTAGAEIVSCDSLQVYRGLDIGSAKPTIEEREEVPHHLLDVVEPGDSFSAVEYARLARAALDEISSRGRLAIVVGGTGLYLRALLQGLFAGPSRNEPLRERLLALARRRGEVRLHRLLGRVDRESAERIHPRDLLRVVRALEVYFETRVPLSGHHRSGSEPLQGFEVKVLGLEPDRDILRARVQERTRSMFERGLLLEVQGLLARGVDPHCRPLRAIGYRQALAVLGGSLDRLQAERDIVADTMRYAKRQMTWFRHQADVEWSKDAEECAQKARAWLEARR